MPPLALIPNRPAGSPDILSYGYGAGMGAARRPTVNGRELTDAELTAIQAYFGALADEDRDRFDVGVDYNNRQLSSLDRNRRAQVRQAKRALAETRRQYDETLKLDRDKFGFEREKFGVDTGVDLLKTGAGMRGALNFVQGDMFAQGATGISPWLQSLRTGQPVAYGGGTATQGHPTPLTVGTLANTMTGGQPNAGAAMGAAPGAARGVDQYGRPLLSPDVQAAVNAGSTAFQEGLANKGLGWWENQTRGQQEGLVSIGDYLGRDTRSEIEYYKRSRPGQGSAQRA